MLAGVLLTAALGGAGQGDRRPLRVLFIGNSLTISHDLPGLVAALAEGGGFPRPLTRAVAVGGFSLEDHWQQGDGRRAITQDAWDYVVLQQGPSAAPASRRLLIEFAGRFAGVIRAAGATPALYMVWPSLDRRQDFAGVSQSYREAAERVRGILLPAGDAWRLSLQRHPGLRPYSEDRLHPTFAGSYLAALVIVDRLFGRMPAGLPAMTLSAADVAALQQAAADAARP